MGGRHWLTGGQQNKCFVWKLHSEDPCPLCLQKTGINAYIHKISDSDPHFSIDYLKKQGLFIHITVYNCQPCDKSPTQSLVNDVENSGHISRSNEVEVRWYNGVRP